ncbi:MAG: adenylate kinase [candidate division Zixibacteria bacterium]|nr:adenylate kinase [candidate division Zixibacteria bacterium]
MQAVLLGPPGSGKGTQAAALADRLGFQHLATGDILREEVKNKTKLGMEAKKFMEKGELVPDKLILEMVSSHLKPDVAYLWDGFPRTEEQAVGLDAMLAVRNLSVDVAVLLEVPDAIIIRRISGRLSCPGCGANYHRETLPSKKEGVCDRCGTRLEARTDDRPEVVARRLAVYREQTSPVMRYYEKQGKLVRVNGDQPPENVTAKLAAVFEAAKGKSQKVDG